MKIIVTGGCGFIGSCLVKYLILKKNIQVLNIDNLSYSSNLLSLKEIRNNPNYFFFKLDICKQKKIFNILKKFKPDGVIHLAAETHVDRSIDGPIKFLNTNIIGTYSLLESVKKYLKIVNKKNFRFVHVSTDEVYGELKNDKKKFNEKNSYKPKSPYSASKASSDHLVQSWFHTFNVPTIITNCGNNYGPGQHPEKLIPHTILAALKNKKIPIYGNGKNIRDWIFVQDHVEAIYEVFQNGVVGEKYNIGANKEINNKTIVKYICNIMDNLKPLKNRSYKNLIEFVSDRPGHDFRYALDIEKIQKNILWKPKYDFHESLLFTVKWYINNYDIWKQGFKNNISLKRIGIGTK